MRASAIMWLIMPTNNKPNPKPARMMSDIKPGRPSAKKPERPASRPVVMEPEPPEEFVEAEASVPASKSPKAKRSGRRLRRWLMGILMFIVIAGLIAGITFLALNYYGR